MTPPVDFHTAPAAAAWQCLTPPGPPWICRVVTRRSGREKLHFLNPVPIRIIHDRWIDKYTEVPASMLVDLKAKLEGKR